MDGQGLGGGKEVDDLMGFSVQVLDRAGDVVYVPEGLTVQPSTWSAEAIGGPRDAEFALSGAPEILMALSAWLGYQIRILSGGALVWFGQVDALQVVAGGLLREVTLDGVANRVKVIYSVRLPGGAIEASETDWSEDLDSANRYGRREYVHSAPSAITETQALALQARLLASLASPQRRLAIAGNRTGATLRARGYWQRLNDVYYAQSAGLEEHTDGAERIVPLGLGFSSAFIGFGGQSGAKDIHQAYGRLFYFADYAGEKIAVAGTAHNDYHHTIAGGTRQEAFSTTSTGISFDPDDDIRNGDFGTLEVGDMIYITGASVGGNNGAKLVKTTGASHIEISPGWSGGNIATEAAGASVTVIRGNRIEVEDAVTIERPDGVTVEVIAAYGQKVYQTFELATDVDWTVAAIEVRGRVIGAPADDLSVSIVSDAGGTPGAVLETITMDPADIEDVVDWLRFEFSNTTLIEYGTVYGILIERTGSMQPDAFYEIELDGDGGYTRGDLYLYDGASYQADAGSLHFRILGAQDNALQVRDVAIGAGTEIVAVVVEDQASIETMQYQTGDETALSIVASLLEQGTAAGGRILAAAQSDLSVRIFEQETATNRLYLWRDGELTLAAGGWPPEGWLPAGVWIHIDDLLLTGAWSGFSPVFVERATYRVGSRLTLDAENQAALFSSLQGVKQG